MSAGDSPAAFVASAASHTCATTFRTPPSVPDVSDSLLLVCSGDSSGTRRCRRLPRTTSIGISCLPARPGRTSRDHLHPATQSSSPLRSWGLDQGSKGSVPHALVVQREVRLRKLRPRHFPQGLCELWPAQAPVGLHTLNCAGSQNPGFGWLGNTQEAPVSTPPKEFHPSMRCRRMSLSLQSCDPHVCRSYAEGVGNAGGFQFPSGPGSRNRSRAGIGVCWTCRAVSGQCMQHEVESLQLVPWEVLVGLLARRSSFARC